MKDRLISHEGLLARIDTKACLDFLASKPRHKSYDQSEGERTLAAFIVQQMTALEIEVKLSSVGASESTGSGPGAERVAARACRAMAM